MNIEVINDIPLSAEENMLRDRGILEKTKEMKKDQCILRVYEWREPSITVGIAQKKEIFDEISMESDGVKIVDRITGGRAVYHQEEITYSIAASSISSLYGDNLYETYQKIAIPLQSFLRKIGINSEVHRNRMKQNHRKYPICFGVNSYYEVVIGDKKIIGSAQKRTSYGFIQHGSIPIEYGQEKLNDYLKNKEEMDISYGKLSDYLSHEMSRDYLKEKLIEAFVESSKDWL